MHQTNNYISFFKAKSLLNEGYLFRQDLQQTWFKITNGKDNFWLNPKTAKKVKSELINKK
jgi:hypothetical protein